MKHISSIVILLFILTTSATAYDDKVKELLGIIKMENSFISMNNVIISQIQSKYFQTAEQEFDASVYTEEQKEQVGKTLQDQFGELVSSYQSHIEENMSYEKITNEIYIPVYKQHYSEKEIDELIQFYKSDLGKKLLETNSKVTEEIATKSAEKYDPLIIEFAEKEISRSIDTVKEKLNEEGLL